MLACSFVFERDYSGPHPQPLSQAWERGVIEPFYEVGLNGYV